MGASLKVVPIFAIAPTSVPTTSVRFTEYSEPGTLCLR